MCVCVCVCGVLLPPRVVVAVAVRFGSVQCIVLGHVVVVVVVVSAGVGSNGSILHIQTDIQTDRHTGRQTARQTEPVSRSSLVRATLLLDSGLGFLVLVLFLIVSNGERPLLTAHNSKIMTCHLHCSLVLDFIVFDGYVAVAAAAAARPTWLRLCSIACCSS